MLSFHDGTPATAKDDQWSFGRLVAVHGFPSFQRKASSPEKPEQFDSPPPGAAQDRAICLCHMISAFALCDQI
jgi:ABC-type transport system substrate-binding protein